MQHTTEQNSMEQDQTALQENLPSARRRIEDGLPGAIPLSGSLSAPPASLSTAQQAQTAGVVTPLEQSVAYALLGEDPAAQAKAQQALRRLVGTLDTVVERKQKVDAMMAQLLSEIRAVRRRARQRTAWRIAMAIFFMLLFVFARGHVFNYWWLFVGGGGAVAADERVGKRREAVHALYRAKEPRAVGVLAIAARDGDYAVQRVADQALRDLLPRVRASDAAYIDHEQMMALLGMAEQGNAQMQVAVLKALQQIGDQRAIPLVESLAVMGRTTAVRNQAQECLPFLTERVRLAREQATLLRGATAPAIAEAPAQLLRPASGAPETPAEQLLRPANG